MGSPCRPPHSGSPGLLSPLWEVPATLGRLSPLWEVPAAPSPLWIPSVLCWKSLSHLVDSVLCGKSLPPSPLFWSPQPFVGSPCHPPHSTGSLGPLWKVPATLPTPLAPSVLCGKSLRPCVRPYGRGSVPTAVGPSLRPWVHPYGRGSVPTALCPSLRPWVRPKGRGSVQTCPLKKENLAKI